MAGSIRVAVISTGNLASGILRYSPGTKSHNCPIAKWWPVIKAAGLKAE
jgi:hypothetical protein